MHINIVTLFPEFFDGPLTCALMQRGREAGILSFSFHNPRDAAHDRHRSVDDRPYGGGPGMVMLPGPVAETLRSLGYRERGQAQPGRLLLMSPTGKRLTQELARELACGLSTAQADTSTGGIADKEVHPLNQQVPPYRNGCDGAKRPEQENRPVLTIVCGRYEGLDARIAEIFPLEAVSVGDFVLNGGEAAALCVVEAVARLLPGFMGHEDSGVEESFSSGLLEYPHYTRPEVFEGLEVPAVLRSGDHERIRLWRRQASLLQTLHSRPELLDGAGLSQADGDFLKARSVERQGRNLYCALVHHPVLDKAQNTVTVSLTNLDIHDIARSSCTYGLGGYYVLTPLEDQRELLRTILAHWRQGPGKTVNPDRDTALSLVRDGGTVQDAIADITRLTGQRPMVVGTAARSLSGGPDTFGYAAIADALRTTPVLLLFGTGHGLSQEVFVHCHAFAPPLRGCGPYNHLSVRSAAAITIDRILGDWR